jgi:glycosyltransferase involved in cell wall biosynthesis
LAQADAAREILVYDDQSTDGTADVVRRFMARDSRIRLIDASPLPAGWCGKPHACWRLAQWAESEWLLFLDADARLAPGALAGLTAAARRRDVTFLSAWPRLVQRSFWERVAMPMLNFSVFTLFPSPLSLLMNARSLGLAHGACILAHRETYFRLDGHRAVRDAIFEDTQLARHWRAAGERGLCLDGSAVVGVRMYESLSDIWNGFLKNFYPAFQREAMFWLFLLVHAGVFLAPFLGLAIAPFTSVPVAPLAAAAALVIVGRVALAIRFGYPVWPALLHPLAELGLLALGIRSRHRFRTAQGVSWKGRVYSAAAVQDSTP